MQKIVPFLWFEDRVEEALEFYTSVFTDFEVVSKQGFGGAGAFKSATVRIYGQEFILFSAGPFAKFSPATSFFINCETQEEVDMLWNKLGDGGKPNRCGWLDDKFGLTWQIVPTALGRLLGDTDRVKANRVMEAMMKMNKIVIADLEKAYDGE
ncbi:VOC family protein [Mucilaginibacter sp. HMF5004]|uniref:VOC family protein n=1 Tax=Mucilaginibacter rivuli TaxID=2857527 RepID=UPI001C60510B|nr:VOC family protein [Mucilaginibacter rivuli]MBW4891614.1 VOC family protein [Mucilaginibacter rivuli]